MSAKGSRLQSRNDLSLILPLFADLIGYRWAVEWSGSLWASHSWLCFSLSAASRQNR